MIVGGISDERRMVLSETGLDISGSDVSALLSAPSAQPFAAEAFGTHIRAVCSSLL